MLPGSPALGDLVTVNFREFRLCEVRLLRLAVVLAVVAGTTTASHAVSHAVAEELEDLATS